MIGPQQIEPTFVSVDQELIRSAINQAENAVEFGHEVLARHDADFGRTLKRHKEQAEYLEAQIAEAKSLTNKLRLAIGWREREWKTPS